MWKLALLMGLVVLTMSMGLRQHQEEVDAAPAPAPAESEITTLSFNELDARCNVETEEACLAVTTLRKLKKRKFGRDYDVSCQWMKGDPKKEERPQPGSLQGSPRLRLITPTPTSTF